jgi:hypothetical protein
MTGGSVDVNVDAATLENATARNPRVLPIAYAVSDTDSGAPAAIVVTNNSGASVNIGRVTIVTPTQQGVSVQGNTSTDVLFSDLRVTDASAEAFVTQSNDAASSVSIVGRSLLSSMSAAVPTFASNDAAQLLIELSSLSSQTVAPQPAVELLGTSIGSFTISDAFTVQVTNLSPPPATLPGPGSDPANVTNLTPVTVTLPPP